MASPSVLTFDADGRAVDFDVWLDDLQLFLQCDSKDGLSLFDLTSGASTTPAADADSVVRSQLLTRDAAARLAVRSHLPSTERAHFSQYKSAKHLYDDVVARYSSPASAALSRLMLPYLFPDLAAFATVTDLITHLRTSDTRYRAALFAEFCAKNPPPMYITLYYLVTRLPDTFRSETLVVTPVPLSLRGAPPFLFCPPLPLLLLSTLLAPSRSALRLTLARGAATARASGARALEEVAGEEVVAVVAEEEVGVGVEAEVGASVGAVEVEAAVTVAVGVEAAEAAAAEVELVEAELGSGDPSTSRALVRPRHHSSFVSGTRGVRGLGIPRWGDLLKSGVAIFDLDFDAILAAMYAVSISAEGDCYVYVPLDPGIEVVALGASESAAPGASESAALGASESAALGTRASALSGTASAQVLHTFTLDSDPSGGPVLAHYSTVLPCPAAPSGSLSGLYLPSFSTNLVSGADLQDGGVHQFTLASQRMIHCTCARTGRHLAIFTRRPGTSLYTLTTGSPPVAASGQVAPSSQVFAAASRLEAPLQTLHMDVWGPARVRGQGHERYFLLVVDDYSRYTTVFSLRSKGEVTEVLIDWIRVARLQLRERFGSDFPVLRLHSDRDVHASGLSKQNGIAERRIGMVMDIARTSMIHAAAPHFLWPFAVQYATHQLNLQPRLSSVTCLRTSCPPVLFLASSSAYPLTRLGPAPSGVSQVDAVKLVEVAVDSGSSGGAEPECAEPGGAESGGAEPGVAEIGGAEPAGAGPGGPLGALSRRELPSPQELREWFARRWSRAAGAGGIAGAGGSASAGVAGRGGATGAGATDAAGDSGAAGVGTTGRTGARAAESSGGPAGAGAAVGAGGTGGGGATGGTGAGGAAGAGALVGAGVDATGAAGGTARAGGTAGVGADASSAVSAQFGGAMRPQPYFVPLLEQVLGLPPSSGPAPSLECPPLVQSESQLELASPLRAPSPYAGSTEGLAERREPESRPALPVRTARTSRRVPRQRSPAVPSTHQMALRPSTASQRVPLPSPPASSLPALADLESDSLRAASPTVTSFLATAVTNPSFESATASALVAELVDFAAHCRLDYAASLVAESASVCPPSVGGECALSTDVLEDRREDFQCFATALPHLVSTVLPPEGDLDAPDIPTPRSYAEAIEGPYSSQWQAAMDTKMASWKSTGIYVDEVPPPGANIVSGMWIFRVKRPPGSPPVFKARYVARGFSQRQGVDYFHTFSPTPKMTTLWVLLHVTAHRDYELNSLDFRTAFLQGSLHEEIWLRCPPSFTGSFPARTQWSLRRPVYGLRQAPREWHDTLRTAPAALRFAPSTADPSLFLRTDTLLPPFYILVYVDDLVFATADIAGLAHVKSESQKRHTCTHLGELRSYVGLQITRDRARRTITLTQSHMVEQVLQRFDFTYSSPQATPLSTRHSLSDLPSDESVEPSGPYPELVGCLMYLMTFTRPDLTYPLSILARYVAPGRHRPEHMATAKRVLRYLCSTSGMGLVLGGQARVVLTGHADASWVDDLATQRSSQGYTFSLGFCSVLWRSTRSSSVLSSSCEAEIYAGAMAAQELRWLTYLLTDLGEPPHSPPVLYVDNKAMPALCREHRLEQRTKQIAFRYFLARELQQLGQLRLAYVASPTNTANIFTKALQHYDHQHFCTMLGL
ncbi:unnamed protein product [Closterium sp. NIES-54]